MVDDEIPIFGVNMWEHAYCLQTSPYLYSHDISSVLICPDLEYLNGKAPYIENIWKVINWKDAERRYVGGREDVFNAFRSSI